MNSPLPAADEPLLIISGLPSSEPTPAWVQAWSSAGVAQWVAPQSLLGPRGAALADHRARIVWLYRAPWGSVGPAGMRLGSWLSLQRQALRQRGHNPGAWVLVNADLLDPEALADHLGLWVDAPVEHSATEAPSAEAAQQQLLWARLFEWAAPQAWDMFEALEAATWAAAGLPAPMLREELPAPEPAAVEALQRKLQEADEYQAQAQKWQARATELEAAEQALLQEAERKLEQAQEDLAIVTAQRDEALAAVEAGQQEADRQLEEARTQASSQIAQVQDALEQAHQELSARTAESEQAQAEAARQFADIQALSSQRETQLKEAQEEGELLLLQLHQVQEELEQLFLQGKEKEAAAAQAMASAQASAEAAQGAAAQAQAERDQAQSELRQTKSALEQSQNAAHQTQAALEQMRQELSARTGERDQARQDLGVRLSERDQARQELDVRTSERDHTRQELYARTVERDQARQDLSARTAESEQARAEASKQLADAQALSAQRETQLKEAQEEGELLLLQLHQVQEELEQLFLQGKEKEAAAAQATASAQASAEAAQGAAAQAQAAVAEAQAAASKAQAERDQARQDLSARTAERDQARESLQQSQASVQQLQAALQQAQGALDQSQGALKQSQSAAHQAQAALEQTRQELNARTSERDQARYDLNVRTTERDQARESLKAALAQAAQQQAESQAAAAQREAQLKESQEEGELLLLQLHQVQEELETHFLRGKELEQQLQSVRARYQRLQSRYPQAVDVDAVEVDKTDPSAEVPFVAWRLKGLSVGGTVWPELVLHTSLEDAGPGVRLEAPAGSSAARGMDGPLVPKALVARDAAQIEHFRGIGQQAWEVLIAACTAVDEVLGAPSSVVPGAPADFDPTFWRQSLGNQAPVLRGLPPVFRHDGVRLKREKVNPDYEHLWLVFDAPSYANRRWQHFEMRIGAAQTMPGLFSHLPKFEFPIGMDALPPFDGWYEESRDDYGAKFELRVDLNRRVFDIATWSRLPQLSQSFILSLIAILPAALRDLQFSGTGLSRPWSDWQRLTVGAMEVLRERLSAQRPPTAEMQRPVPTLPPEPTMQAVAPPPAAESTSSTKASAPTTTTGQKRSSSAKVTKPVQVQARREAAVPPARRSPSKRKP